VVRLLIAIPVYNEQKYVCRVLDKVRAVLDEVGCTCGTGFGPVNHGLEARATTDIRPGLLVVDDGSTDDTPNLLAARSDACVIRHPTNLGYGQSLIDAFDFADAHGFDWVITMDCDEQHEPERIPDFVREIRSDRWDIISGSRYLQPGCADDLPPGDRRSINATITAMLNERLGLNITDAFCGYKAHRVSAMRRLRLDVTGYAFPMQLWPQAVRRGLRITELPVRLIYNDPTRHFGGNLDDAGVRLRHYLEVFERELRRLAEEKDAGGDAPASDPYKAATRARLAACGCME
jgi:glycosyltransferase involved in cell wall biosynthesis